jgi:hypothetical protein
MEPSVLKLIRRISQAQEALFLHVGGELPHSVSTANHPLRWVSLGLKLTVINFDLFDPHIS